MPRTIISFDDDDSDAYVDFLPHPASGRNRARSPPLQTPPTVIDIPDDNEPLNSDLQQELERSKTEIADIDRKIAEFHKSIAELQQLRSIREHDMVSVQSQMEMRYRTGRQRVLHQFDYETRMDFDWSEELVDRMKTVFGLEKFRHCQQGVCNAVMDKRDVFCVMPTGGGKSLTYQLPALLQSGCTLVISPLLALISDQVFHLLDLGIHAVRLTSGTKENERQHIYSQLYGMANGTLSGPEIKLCYVTPEMILRSSKFKGMLSKLLDGGKFARIVLDEAHCVSELGHDFRKDYGELGILRAYYPDVPILALSATCPPHVLNNVLDTLKMKSVIEHNDPQRTLYFSSPLYRKNLHYSILPKAESTKEAIKEISQYILEKHPHDTGIIYCRRQKDSEMVAREVQAVSMGKIKTGVYHAGITDAQKENLHKEWRNGNIKVVCATIAFGLGIDKADVRFVLHYSVPKSVECYYQESGRAGRDGKDSDCVLYYRPQDTTNLFALVAGQRDGGRDKVLAMIRFSENLVRCRKLLFTQYFSVASQLDKSSWTTDDVDASEPCGHCDNCTRSPGSIELRDVTQDAWKLVKILAAIGRPTTLKKLTALARGNSGGAYELPQGQKGRLDLKELIGAPISLRAIDAEHLFNHMMTERYFVEKLDPNEHTTNVYFASGPAANKLLTATLDNMPQGVVQHTFVRRVRAPTAPKVKKQESGKESVGRGKRKRAVADDVHVRNERARSEGEAEEVEREILDLTGYESEMDVDDHGEEDELAYGWSRSILCEPPPIKRRRRRQRSRQSTEYAPDSESEREREREQEDVILISSD